MSILKPPSHQWIKKVIEETHERIDHLEEKVQQAEAAVRKPLVLVRQSEGEN